MKRMSYQEFAGIREDEMRLIDVREEHEWNRVRLAGAEFFALSRLQAGELPEKDDRPTYLICHMGGRSAMAAGILEQAGWTECTNIDGGMAAAISMNDDKLEH